MRITCLILGVMCLLISLPVMAADDEIVFKNGKTIKGTVVNSDNESVWFDQGTGPTRYDLSGITRVKRAGQADVSSNLGTMTGPLQQQVDAAMKAQRYEEVLTTLLKAAKSNPGSANDYANTFVGAYTNLKAAANQNLKSSPEQAYKDYLVLWNTLANTDSRQMMNAYISQPPLYESEVQQMPKQFAAAAYAYGEQKAQDGKGLQEAEFLFSQAVSQDPQDTYKLRYAFVLNTNGKHPEAYRNYFEVTRSDKATQEQKQVAQDRMNSLKQKYPGVAAGTATAAPTPSVAVAIATPAAPVPTAAVAATATQPNPAPAAATPAAAPTPTPAAGQEPGLFSMEKWKEWKNKITNGAILSVLKDIWSQITSGVYTEWIIGIPVFILVFWIGPYYFLKHRSNKGDLAAAELRPYAKKLGLLMLIPWALKSIRRPVAKNRCPFCNKGIDNIDSYGDLNFLICPHCHENIGQPMYSLSDYIDHYVRQVELAARKAKSGSDFIEKDAMTKLVNSVLTMAVRKRASDLHIETEMEGAKIRARIDGMMYDLMTLPKGITAPLISHIKILADLDITEKRVPQDGKATKWIDKAEIDLRINTSPASLGEKVSIRILNQKAVTVDPTKLGLEGELLEVYERCIHKPHGLIIVTGPSGSGKSTTLYVALNELNTGERNIITIEDPIEYQLKGLSQMQVNPAANFTFANGMRSILRQDPDVIMVGEIRDRETADIAIEAAMTGHLVFTTLHTIDSPTAFTRLADLGVETRRLANAVICIIAQRLIRTICPDCKKPYKPKKTDLELLGIASSSKDFTFVHGAGCDNCMNTGFYGRLALFEFLVPDQSMREILETNAAVSVIRDLAKRKGARNLREEGLVKVMQGITTIEEVIRVTT